MGSEVHGPTCLFPGRKNGGDLVTTTTTNSDDSSSSVVLDDVELVTVPAVVGRLLRFEGSILHAVPRPADLWLLPFTKYGPREPESEYGRSVVLFNTWPADDDDPPPRDVHVDDTTKLDSNSSSSSSNSDMVQCERYESWNEAFIQDKSMTDDSDFVSKCKIWLLGDLPRRGHPDRNVRLQAASDLKDVLEEPHHPASTYLRK